MQLASFFSGSSIEQSGGHNHNVSDYSARAARDTLIKAGSLFDCKFCDWKSRSDNSSLKDVDMCPSWDTLPGDDKEKRGVLNALNDDVLLVVISYLDTPSLLIFGSVYDRVKRLVTDTNVRI